MKSTCLVPFSPGMCDCTGKMGREKVEDSEWWILANDSV